MTAALTLLLIQIIVIIGLTFCFGRIAAKVGLAIVIGEMLAGIALGPSLLGAQFPEFQQTLFPAESLPTLKFIASIGIYLYMLKTGWEMDFATLKFEQKSVGLLAAFSTLMPFICGMVVALPLFALGYFETGQMFEAALFLGMCFSITALPVLARLIDEFHLRHTKIARWSLSASALSDLSAWLLLAVFISAHDLNGLLIPAFLVIGIALQKVISADFMKRYSWLLGLLLPFYFVHVGLKTDFVSLFSGGHIVLIMTVLIAALASKLLAGYLFGVFRKLPARESWQLGLMLNTRGLMELILLEQGRELGLIGPELHAALVFMTIVTTVMAAPLLRIMNTGRFKTVNSL